ncbi:hypothetical protein GUITHDRAFT_102782 [Guillardia theta CCMP2712]|uniref:Uncharacterized protein n=1 Tax=Guillardia theta (strain CCMP2712) TaxID=905079 RepID=L1JTV9_GUITC|nr:hypothetical protein GUITHDRAFT_102782 [Guillardia theta CCMP2712]EKX51518.1 hypothetical protein GUITHDRAFT_102782 [Guillardia theta CCMP2712]|eukprot:XP_005838498.1 hypothetical protein GUITHDRAFT_102782 [Guillardia theta CCMP2712]
MECRVCSTACFDAPLVNNKSQGEGERQKDSSFVGLVFGAIVIVMLDVRRSLCEEEQSPPQGQLMSKDSIEKIATLINALVDMDYFTEEEEQEIFEHAVTMVLQEIERILPPPVLRLVIHSDDKDGIDEEHAESMKSRLIEFVKWNIKIPYLDATDEARVVTAVCAVIVESLKKGKSFKNVVEPVNSGELIMDVFVKGSVGLLDSANKKQFVETICEDLQIPFVPDRLKTWLVGMMVEAVGEVFEASILAVYQNRISEAYDWAADRVADAKESEAFKLLRQQRPYSRWSWLGNRISAKEYVDKRSEAKFGEEVRDCLVNELNEKINVIGWVCDKFEEWEGILIRNIVDLTLMESMDMEKMEGSVAYLCKENFGCTYPCFNYASSTDAQDNCCTSSNQSR